MKRILGALLAIPLTLTVACGVDSGGGGDNAAAAGKHGPITIWYSNNADEVAWGKAMVAKWNA
jgi:multiple sugar transport system substrate-binding protein